MSRLSDAGTNLIQKIKNSLSLGYGSSIIVIAEETFVSGVREKKFYLSLFYFTIFPTLLFLLGNTGLVVQSGTGFALYEAQNQTATLIYAFYTTFFLGQVLLVIISADAIAGEIEQDTLILIKSKPVYDSEIVIGKFIGILAIIFLLETPAFILLYLFLLARYDAGSIGVYLGSIDELIGVLVILLLIQGIIIAMSLVFSALFSKTLYSILGSMLSLFMLQQISGSLSQDANYISFPWLVQATIPEIFYNIEPISNKLPSLLEFVLGFIVTICLLLAVTISIMRNRELK